MTEPDRTADDDTNSLDLRDWHHTDRPDCLNNTNWIVGPPGYHCVACDWWCSCD
jgi:hypothetical protein